MISNKRQKFVEDYENITILGKGTYGTVYKVKDKIDGQIYAIKKMAKLERTEGLSLTSIREITLLQQCKHENIIQLKQVVRSKSDNEIYLVMEFCESDLDTIYDKALGQPQKKRKIENKQNQQVQVLTDKQIKNIMRQLIKGVKYLHDNCIVHRDLKLSNLLINLDGSLKIADFGLARRIGNQPPHQYTPRVVTLWYRSPELLLSNWKDLNYIKSIDIWSIGCILGQLLQNGNPIMPGSSELEEMELICDLLGMPESDTQIYECLMQQNSNLFQKGYQNKIDERFKSCDPNALDLMKQMLKWEPKERISLEKAILHAYFEESQENILN